MAGNSCEFCANYAYDEDEDEMFRFLSGNTGACPYFTSGDEYKVVRHQM